MIYTQLTELEWGSSSSSLGSEINLQTAFSSCVSDTASLKGVRSEHRSYGFLWKGVVPDDDKMKLSNLPKLEVPQLDHRQGLRPQKHKHCIRAYTSSRFRASTPASSSQRIPSLDSSQDSHPKISERRYGCLFSSSESLCSERRG